MKRAMICLVLLSIPVLAQGRRPSKLGRILYRSGQVAVVLANSIDIGSSWGKHELNPLLASPNGTFGVRGASVKIGFVGLGLAATELIVRKRPNLQLYIGALDFAVAGVEGAAAAHNLAYSPAIAK